MGAHKFGGLRGFVTALFERAAGTEFAASEIDDGEGDGPFTEKQSDAADAPFDVVGMRSKEEYVYGHDRFTLNFTRRNG